MSLLSEAKAQEASASTIAALEADLEQAKRERNEAKPVRLRLADAQDRADRKKKATEAGRAHIAEVEAQLVQLRAAQVEVEAAQEAAEQEVAKIAALPQHPAEADDKDKDKKPAPVEVAQLLETHDFSCFFQLDGLNPEQAKAQQARLAGWVKEQAAAAAAKEEAAKKQAEDEQRAQEEERRRQPGDRGHGAGENPDMEVDLGAMSALFLNDEFVQEFRGLEEGERNKRLAERMRDLNSAKRQKQNPQSTG